MPTRRTEAKADATAAGKQNGHPARRIPGGATQGEPNVARHAPLGSRAAGHPDPRDQDEVAAGRQGQRVGYARVSTRQQDLALQLDALEQAGCARVFRDVGSGTIRKRPQLEACLDYLRVGDSLVVWRLDRLGRSLRHLVDVVAQLEQRQVAFHSLREAIDTTTANGKLQLHIFAALAEFERELIRERSQAGREVAKAAGRLGGRPLKLTPEKRAAALAMRERGDMTMTQIARALGVGRTTLYDHLGDLPRLDGIDRTGTDKLMA
jgi:DNA invertase Pin-like site-specific DNA recombinase